MFIEHVEKTKVQQLRLRKQLWNGEYDGSFLKRIAEKQLTEYNKDVRAAERWLKTCEIM